MANSKKKVGIFSFTCDEGCSIYLIEIFNQKLLKWLESMELDYFLSVKDHKELAEMDIALIEGVISTEKDKEAIEKIRAKTKILIAMGTCAITALPSGQRNKFDEEQVSKIKDDLERWHFLPKALALKDAVTVDDEIAGCPIDKDKLIEVFEKHLYA
jgi:coenzyme F420-reducing hydrogenase gamma subunit